MSKISVVINTLNEEKHIKDCILSVNKYADEIIVCDMHSDDKTVEIAMELGAKLITYPRKNYVEPARYYAINASNYEWVLVLDADERMTEKMWLEIKKIISDNEYDLVMVGILYNYFGKYIKHGGFYNNNFPRIFKKKKYIEFYNDDEIQVHSNFRNLEKFIQKKIVLPKSIFILHEAYPTFEKFLKKGLSYYTLLESKQRYEKGETIIYYKIWLIPLKEFIKRYFIQKGYRDGKIGLILCFLKSIHTLFILLNIWFLNISKHEKN